MAQTAHTPPAISSNPLSLVTMGSSCWTVVPFTAGGGGHAFQGGSRAPKALRGPLGPGAHVLSIAAGRNHTSSFLCQSIWCEELTDSRIRRARRMCSCGCWEATTHGACLADPDERHRLEMAGGGRATHALKFAGGGNRGLWCFVSGGKRGGAAPGKRDAAPRPPPPTTHSHGTPPSLRGWRIDLTISCSHENEYSTATLPQALVGGIRVKTVGRERAHGIGQHTRPRFNAFLMKVQALCFSANIRRTSTASLQ